jgi:GT2 family glycosyltransferase
VRETSAGAQADLACVVINYRDQPEALAAVRSLLDQSEPVEVILVNSGGGDSAQRLREANFEIPVISRAERLYPGAARNLGIAATAAPYVAFLAADCIAEPGWAAARLRRHRAGADAVSGALSNAFPLSRSACAQHLLLHHRRMPGALEGERLLFSLSYNRRLFARHGRFREELRQSEDTEFNARLNESGTVVWEPGAVASHRYPATAAGLVRDQFRRGRRHALAERRGDQVWTQRLGLRVTALRLRDAVSHARRMDGKQGRRTLHRGAPMLLPALIAHWAGTVAGRLTPLGRAGAREAAGIPAAAAPGGAPDPSRR